MTGQQARTANKVLPKAGLNGFDWIFVNKRISKNTYRQPIKFIV